jgi:2,4-dienoyl-CoA reductase-like NADH-dependent reductase (Old Yellow Enzyme family)
MPNVFENPFKFKCGLTSKNRVVFAPLTNMQSPGTTLSTEEYLWLKRRIDGGFGIVTTCATHVEKTAQAWDGELGIFSDDHIAGFNKLSLAADTQDCFVIPQLFHGGFRSPSKVTGVQPVSASEFDINTPGFERPRALEEHEITNLQNSFVDAAIRATRAGLRGLEIHGANGYQFTQFLSPHTNLRGDRWGGSLENRSRFLIDVVKRVRQAIGPQKILGVRISPENTKLIHSIDIDEMIDVAIELHNCGVDYVSLSLWHSLKTSDKYPDQKVVELFRKQLPSATALTTSGKIWTTQEAVQTHEAGADFVVLGASAIANPTWPKSAQVQNFQPQRLPLTPQQLADVAVSPRFIEYLKTWNYVKQEPI